MPIIDCDAHVVETEHTWDFIDPSDAKYRPQIVTAEDGAKYWVIDGKLRGRARGPVGASGVRLLYRVGHGLRVLHLKSGRVTRVWTPRRAPLSASLEGRRIAWVENDAAHGRVWRLVLPR
jgi:hypothetical protein